MRRVVSLIVSVSVGALAHGALAVAELEPNDGFLERQILSPGEASLEGDLADVFASSDESRAGTLAMGAVDSYTLMATPSVPFTAWIDNLLVDPGLDPDPDTVLGEFDTLDALIDFNDDASPLGDGLASALSGIVNPDGTLRLKVTGWADFDFDGQDDNVGGPHPESGAYTLFVRIGEAPDVDYVTFTGLTPGVPFDAEIVAAEFDTVMGRYDDTGTQIDFDDNGGSGTSSRLLGDVPPSGELHLAIGAFFDSDLDGEIDLGAYQVGSYVVTLPEPRASWLAASALAGVAGLARLRRARGGRIARLRS